MFIFSLCISELISLVITCHLCATREPHPVQHRSQLLSRLEEILLLAGTLCEGRRRPLYLGMYLSSVTELCGDLVARRSFVNSASMARLTDKANDSLCECCALRANPALRRHADAWTACE